MHRTIFICLLLFISVPATIKGQRPIDMPRLQMVRDNIGAVENGEEALTELIRRAERELVRTVPAVTEKEIIAASGDPHDYVSMGPYWWPNPDTPDGLPYIQRDGQRNPESEKLDRTKLNYLSGNVTNLCYAYFFTANEIYAAKAVGTLKKWFVDPETRMNPNLNYAQMIPGRNDGLGRGIGIIDTYCFVEIVDCIRLLEGSQALDDETYSALRCWFSELSDWMLASGHGADEMMATNNHSIAYDVQVAAYASFAGRQTVLKEITMRFPRMRLHKQIMPDGSQPRELGRTMAMHYTLYNLEHMMDMCVLARRVGIELYPQSPGNGISISKAVGFIAAFIGKPIEEFPYREISPWDANRQKLAWTLRRSTLFEPDGNYDILFERFADASPGDLQWLLLAK